MFENSSKVFLVLLILVLLHERNNCERNFGVGIYYMNYTAGKTYNFTMFNYKYYNVDNALVVYVEFKLPENNPIIIAHITLDVLRANNKKMNLLTTVQNMCTILNGVYNTRLIRIITEEIMRATNMKCPFLANKTYIVNNYTLKPEFLPPFLSPIHWVIQTQFTIGKKTLGYMSLHGNIYKLKTK